MGRLIHRIFHIYQLPINHRNFSETQYDLFSDIPALEPNLPKNMKKFGNIGKLIVVELKEKNNNETTTLVLFGKLMNY